VMKPLPMNPTPSLRSMRLRSDRGAYHAASLPI
jgi:hypothetical protein